MLVVAAILAVIFALMGRDETPNDVMPRDITLTDHADASSEVSFTTYGRIVGQDEFQAIRITVNQSQRTLDILSGYELSVEERVQFSNTAAAYEAFLHALENVRFTDVIEGEPEREDGKCPTVRRHVYHLRVDGDARLRTWSSPCRGERGNFGGERRAVERLFQEQITDYRDHTRGIRL